jgi:Fe-S-cluster containining protein
MPTADEIAGRVAENRKWVLDKLRQNGDVPCGACQVCCYKRAVFLYVEAGDDPAMFPEHTIQFNAYWGGWQPMLNHRPDGGCIYLTDKGCGVWDHRPAACRAFSCITQFELITANERKEMKRTGKWSATLREGQRQWRAREKSAAR